MDTLAQPRPLDPPGPETGGAAEWLRIGGVTLAVRDLHRVTAFYRDVIGLEVVAQEGDAVRLGAGGAAFLDLLHRPGALPDDPGAAGLFHTAFLLPSRAGLGRWLAQFRALGGLLDGGADHLVSEAAYLHDPEGNGVEMYADRPPAEWRWQGEGAGRRIEMANRPLDVPGLLRAAATPWGGALPGTRIGHVHLRVGDVGEAVRFYGDALGVDLTAAWDSAAFLSSGGYHHHIAVNTWRSPGAGRRDPARAGLASVTLDIADGPALAGIARRLGAAGHRFEDPWGTALILRAAASCGQPASPSRPS
jgi:catechol 2,3-dioxygenase